MVLSAPERDPLAALWRLDPDVRACLCAAAVMGVLLLGVKGYLVDAWVTGRHDTHTAFQVSSLIVFPRVPSRDAEQFAVRLLL
jgi:hypothetical protein